MINTPFVWLSVKTKDRKTKNVKTCWLQWRNVHLVEAVLVRRDDVGEAQRLLVSGGVLQHAEQQEGEAGQAQGAQCCHLVAALGILLRVLQTITHIF